MKNNIKNNSTDFNFNSCAKMAPLNVLIMAEHYSPSYKAGGTVRSLENIVTALNNDINFNVITRHHDFADPTPYTQVIENKWQPYAGANCYYLSKTGISELKQAIKNKEWDILYVNSFFSFWFSLIPIIFWQLGLLKANKVIVAPMGELNKGALHRKWFKKAIYRIVCKLLFIHKNVEWQGINNSETANIKKYYAGKNAIVHTVPDVACLPCPPKKPLKKDKNSLNLMFISRICENKGLHRALKALKNIKTANINFDIYGPKEKDDYWLTIENLIKELPKNITVNYKGGLKPNNVMKTFAKYHAFILPTDFENFGHAIAEGLSAGCIAIISNKTVLWNDIKNKNAGYICELENIDEYTHSIKELAETTQKQYEKIQKNSLNYISNNQAIKKSIQQNVAMFGL